GGRAGLMGAGHPAGRAPALFAPVLPRLHQLDATGLAAPAGVDLRLDDEQWRTEIARSLDRLLDREGRMSARHRHAEFLQHRLGLIFVDVHADLYVSQMPCRRTNLCSLGQAWLLGASGASAAALRQRHDPPHLARLGAIFLQASTRAATASADSSNMAGSALFN